MVSRKPNSKDTWKISREFIFANYQFWKISQELIFPNRQFQGSKKEFIFANLAKICQIRENFFPPRFLPLRYMALIGSKNVWKLFAPAIL